MATEYYYKAGACYDAVRQNQKIFLIYTYKCNATCEHCLTESDPRKSEKLSVGSVKELLRAGISYGKNWLMISGGEPLLYFSEIEEICADATKLGYYCCVGTNAFWAKSPSTAHQRLARLKAAGLKALFPSATTYHSAFVPTKRVEMAAAACAELGLICEINFYPSPDRSSDASIMRRLNLDSRPYYTDGLIVTGRDVSHLRPHFEQRCPGDLDDCGSVHFSVTPRGDVICNCNVTYRCQEFSNSVFHLGNLFEDGIETVLRREQQSEILQLMMAVQRNVVHDILAADGDVGGEYVSRFGARRYNSATEYYLDVLAVDKFRDAMCRAAAAPRL